MSKHYCDYTWKNGVPFGIRATAEKAEITYKLLADPYRKRISIEEWHQGKFSHISYDSALLDFRRLQPAEQYAWQKVITSESIDRITAEIRDQDDRTILIESYHYERGLCRRCVAKSPHGPTVSTQQIYYSSLGDAFDGVLLCDSSGRPVMYKRYIFDEEKREFGELLQEEWDMINGPPNLKSGVANA